ncbi:hypothetical protein [Streptomyces sp. 142MFCol3.1]|uniref:hypothetical protein n=1 Tax=Streptomyces sp. 142MFCol3.1 TaxID=1172179 RepID=UPI00056CDE5C|nr:hypothetical protein [Streptomyces sp. 142MFCol3.1]
MDDEPEPPAEDEPSPPVEPLPPVEPPVPPVEPLPATARVMAALSFFLFSSNGRAGPSSATEPLAPATALVIFSSKSYVPSYAASTQACEVPHS